MSTEQSSDKPAALWRNRDYLLLTSGETVSALGGAVASFALPLVVLDVTGSPTSAALVGLAGGLGYLLASLVVGGWVDTHSRRAAMAGSLALRTASWLLLAIMIGWGWGTTPVLALIATCGSIGAATYRAAEAGALKTLIRPEQFPVAVSVVEGRFAVADLAGGPFGALLFTIANYVPLLFNAVTFLASLIGVFGIRGDLGKPAAARSDRLRETLHEGFRYIWGQNAFRVIMFSQMLSNFGTNAFALALILILKRQGEEYWEIGLLQTCIGASLLGGSLFAGRLARQYPVGQLAIASAALRGLTLLAIAFLHSHIVIVLLLSCAAYLVAPAANSGTQSYLAIITPDRLQGRVAGADEFASGALMPFAVLAGGVLVGRISPSGTLSILAAIVIGGALMLLIARSVRHLPRLSQLDADVPDR